MRNHFLVGGLAVIVLIIGVGYLVTSKPSGIDKINIAGIDADNDGVRDDIERWIDETYPDSARKRAALRQQARLFQNVLLSVDSKEATVKAIKAATDSDYCLEQVFGSFDEMVRVSNELHARILNTRERSDAFLQADKHFSRSVYSGVPYSERNKQCDFDVDSLPN